MSLERFYESYPGNHELPGVVKDEQEATKVDTTPLRYLAGRLIGVGSVGVKEVNDRLKTQHGGDTFQDSQRVFNNSREEFAAIFFGTTLACLMDSRENGYFDMDQWVRLTNKSVADTIISEFYVPNFIPNQEILNEAKKKQMEDACENDPTFSIFFKNPFLLPDSIRRYLEDHGFLEYLQSLDLIERWEVRAKILLAAGERPDGAGNTGTSDGESVTPPLLSAPAALAQAAEILEKLEF